MGDIVNLRRLRKTRDRAGRAEDAARNRAAFGRTREEREASADAAIRAAAKLDGHHRGDGRHAEGRDRGPADDGATG